MAVPTCPEHPRRRAALGLALTLVVAILAPGSALGASAPAGPTARSAGRPFAGQVVATLRADHAIYALPGSRRIGRISRQRPITGEATALPVVASRSGRHSAWLLVSLPGRLLPGAPNGRVGWIRATGTRLSVINWHIVVSLGQRLARAYYAGHLRRSWLVVVGAPSSPTPQGQFFVEENIAEPPSFPGAPYALATSARSTVFTEFDGGPGQVALHGIGGGLGGTPGTAESHGCVRFATGAITWLARRIYPGTPVTITG